MVGRMVLWRMGSRGLVGAKRMKGMGQLASSLTLPLKRIHQKEGFVLKEGDIRGHEILSRRMVKLI